MLNETTGELRANLAGLDVNNVVDDDGADDDDDDDDAVDVVVDVEAGMGVIDKPLIPLEEIASVTVGAIDGTVEQAVNNCELIVVKFELRPFKIVDGPTEVAVFDETLDIISSRKWSSLGSILSGLISRANID